MGVQSLFLLSDTGEVLFEKHERGRATDRGVCSWYWTEVEKFNEQKEVPPLLVSPTYYITHIVRDGITFLACTQEETPPLLCLEFLYRVASVLTEYLGKLDEDALKDHFITVYQLLDEMMDSGLPLTTEPNILKGLIPPPSLVDLVVNALVPSNPASNPPSQGAAVPWRASGVKHPSNEIYFDLVEELDIAINRDGSTSDGEIYGEVLATSRLSGMPTVLVSFGEPALFSDVRFHPCVKVKAWEADRVLTFVPPDGAFKLMSYRVEGIRTSPLYVRPQFSYKDGAGRVTVLLGEKMPNKVVDSITLVLPLPQAVTSAELAANCGSVHYDAASKTCTWQLGKVPVDKAPCLSGRLTLEPGCDRPRDYPPMLLGWRLVGTALSGVRIDAMNIMHESYKSFKGVRALTRAGSYEIRV
ncbi:Clathrin-associated protein medium chain [Klebsormidium nitens]|uniref:Clathrin-associated protein medium chain n=1 Tax=Klebsormidium nitens TaxID=105231 RepID=A0A0U9HQQ1_KLENI|nr:Clathrin-associated protein medium chain [Klebsormidium nitens]|eukprot:GAQ80997.1 Clathrin-associated protein medium chain [Klebsormidium nitens]